MIQGRKSLLPSDVKVKFDRYLVLPSNVHLKSQKQCKQSLELNQTFQNEMKTVFTNKFKRLNAHHQGKHGLLASCGILFGRGNIFCKLFSLSLKSTNTQWALCTNKQNKTLTIYALCCNESHRFIPVISLLFAISDLNVNLKLHS